MSDVEHVDIDAVVAKFTQPEEAPEENAATDSEQEEHAAVESEQDEGQIEQEQPEPQREESAQPGVELKAKQLAALARREAALREREQALKQAEAEAGNVEALKQLALRDPVALLRQLGVSNLADVASQLWYTELGDDAPEEFRQQVKERSVRAELEEIKRKLEEKEKSSQDAAYQYQIAAADRELQSFVQRVPEDMPFLSLEAQENPDEAYRAMCQVAAGYIQAGKWPSALEVAQALEMQMRAEWERFEKRRPQQKQAQAAEPKAKAKPARHTPSTISDADTNIRPDRQPDGLLTDDEYRARAAKVLKQHGLA